MSTVLSVCTAKRIYVDHSFSVHDAVKGAASHDIIELAEGTHMLRETIREVPEGVSFVSSGGSVLSGGVQLGADDFTKSATIPDAYEAVVSSFNGLTDTLDTGMLTECGNNKSELFFNHARQTLARHPNIGPDGYWQWLHVAAVTSNFSFIFAQEDLPVFQKIVTSGQNLSSVWLHGYWEYDWADNYVQIQDISLETRTITINQATPFLYGVYAKARYMVVNSKAHLDYPNEYFLEAKGKLYFIPNKTLDSNDEIFLSNLTAVVQLSNTNGLRFENISMLYAKEGNLILTNTNNTILSNGLFGSSGSLGVDLNGYNNTVSNLSITDVGCIGLKMGGGDVKTLQPSNSWVGGCHIAKVGDWKRTYQPAIHFSGVGYVIEDNTLTNGPHAGIQGGGNDILFKNNDVSHFTYETVDSGAWYSGRSWVLRNNTLVGNHFSDINTVVPATMGALSSQAIYNDDQLSGNTFINNTFTRCFKGIFIGGGRHHLVEGNTFINCSSCSVHMDDRGQTWQTEYCTPGGIFWQEMDALNYKSPPYSVAYPALENMDSPCTPVHNVIRNNKWCNPTSNFVDFTTKQSEQWNVTLEGNTEFKGC